MGGRARGEETFLLPVMKHHLKFLQYCNLTPYDTVYVLPKNKRETHTLLKCYLELLEK